MADKKRVNVTVCSDPATIRNDATMLDVYSYAGNLARLIEHEFGCVVCLHFGSGERTLADNTLVSERIRSIETSGEWLKLLP